MVRVPSQHGLQKKFKPWRKGKSVKAKKQGSLKQQLRGLERLLAKLTRSGESDEATTARAAELRTSIASMKAQIAEKESQEQEREHANKSHGTRFLERQRLTRMERTVRKGCSKDKNRELLQIAMDQIYVAHYPLSKPYRPLFKNKKRHLHHSVSRAQLRNSILQDLKNNKIERVNWISQEQYASLPSDWSVMEEVEFFNYPNGGKSKKAKTTSNDNRFSVNSKHDVLLEAANRLESKLDKKEKQEVDARDLDVDDVETEGSSDESRHDDEAIEAFKSINYTKRKRGGDSSSSSDSDDSSDASADPLQRNGKAEASRILTKEALQEDLDSSNNRNSTNERIERKFQKQPYKSDESGSSDSSSTDDDVDERQVETFARAIENMGNEENNSDSDDDFFVAAKENDVNVFDLVKDKPEQLLPAENPAKGDKSQGWATQEQRPGRYKKKRSRW